MRVEVIVEEIHTEMTENADAPDAHTTMTGQNLWQQVSLPLKQIKAEDGRLRSNHLLRDCREFDRLADKFVAL